MTEAQKGGGEFFVDYHAPGRDRSVELRLVAAHPSTPRAT